MPPRFSRDVAWIIQGCVLILHMMSVAMTTFMNQPAVAETRNRVRFTMESGVLSFWRRPENFALHLIHRILNVTYTLDVNLRVTVHPEVSEQPQPSPLPIPIRSRPILFHRQGSGTTPDTIVPPGVPFKLPCPICQRPLEQGQICRHSDPWSTIIRRDHTEPLRVHQESPFVFCRHLPNPDAGQSYTHYPPSVPYQSSDSRRLRRQRNSSFFASENNHARCLSLNFQYQRTLSHKREKRIS